MANCMTGSALLHRSAGVAFALSADSLKNAAAAQDPTVLIAVCLFIERPQSVHNIVKAHWCAVRSSA